MLTSGTEPYKAAQAFFSQILRADQLMLGRWVNTDVPPGFISGPALEEDFEVWAAISDGTFSVTDGTGTDDLTAVDFTGVTALSQILTELNAQLAALVAPSVSGLENAEFKFDSQDRLVLEMLGEAFGSPTITIEAEGTGTDLAVLMDVANGISFAGVEKEEPEEALTAISELDDSYYNIDFDRNGTDNQMVALATFVETKVKQLDLFVTADAAKTSGTTTDVGSQVQALSLKRTMCCYSEKTAEYPDMAVSGAVLPADEGTTNFAFSPVSGATHSGLTKQLTVTEKSVLGGKGYVWMETVGSVTYMYDGLTGSGNEKRIILGVDWFEARVAEDIFTDLLNSPLNSFDNATLTKIEGIIRYWANEAIARGIFQDTAARPFLVTLGDADDISSSERATHKLTITDAFTGFLNSSINDYRIIGNISI